MKKTIEQYFCDDCGKEIHDPKESVSLTIKSEKSGGGCVREYMLFCFSCVGWRINHSLSIIKDIKCPNCNGKGYVREAYYHNEYSKEQCPVCKGKGVRL